MLMITLLVLHFSLDIVLFRFHTTASPSENEKTQSSKHKLISLSSKTTSDLRDRSDNYNRH